MVEFKITIIKISFTFEIFVQLKKYLPTFPGRKYMLNSSPNRECHSPQAFLPDTWLLVWLPQLSGSCISSNRGLFPALSCL